MLRERPIPDLAATRAAKEGYRKHPIDLNGTESSDGWSDIRTRLAGVNYYYRTDNPPYHQRCASAIEALYVRTGVQERLERVNAQLAPLGLELFIHDAWRPAALQYSMRNVWFTGEMQLRYPEWTDEQVEANVAAYWAAAAPTEEGIDPLSPPPHSTGGAVDLTIRAKDGDPLWMGTILDDVTKRAHTDALEAPSDELSFSDEEARANRRLLYWLMLDAGFVNNPTEWWHFSYGDQMWARLVPLQDGGPPRNAFYSNIVPDAVP